MDKSMHEPGNTEAIIQNLKDVGCDEDTIADFMDSFKEHNKEDGLKLLAAHRRTLLNNLHKEQKCIDCLDYLVYELEKNEQK